MPTPRELRLLSEFEGMKALRSRNSLFDFLCADLSDKQARAFLMGNLPADLSDFLTPEEFEQKHPGIPPEKYLILYYCTGLLMEEDGTIRENSRHLMEVVYGWRYPTERPNFIWHTPIWHPNFRMPFICIEGRPFAVGLTLSQIVLAVGRMIQYQNYNVKDPLNSVAAEWAKQRANLFPVDDRDILDSRHRISKKQVTSFNTQGEPLVQIVSSGQSELNQLIELIEHDTEK